jgi:hypothetical protein
LSLFCSELPSGMQDDDGHPWWWRQHAPLIRRSTIILHTTVHPRRHSELHTRRRENLKSRMSLFCFPLSFSSTKALR